MKDITFRNSMKYGDLTTKLSLLILGLGNFRGRQIIKGILYIALEAAFIIFMIIKGISCIAGLPGLGSREQEEIWNEKLGIYEYVQGDNSLLILLYGITVIFIICAYIILAVSSLKSAYNVELRMKQGKHINTFVEDIKALFNENLHKLLLVLPVTGILVFTILPLVFMISMAFTSYSKVDSHLVLFDWVGLENFKLIFNSGSSIGQSFWRFIFILSIAIPQFVSLLIIRSMLAQDGIINVVLKNAGWISKSLPFFTNATWARMTVIIVNLWIGIPYTILQVTGILQNIPMELYEAADVDGANGFVKFFKITMPYMLFVTTPYLITTFTANVNNFNIVYLLTKGDPVLAGHTAGKTDLLVTWLYKMTVDYQYYNLGAVIGIMTFVFLALGSLLVYRRTKSYKDEEGFQ